MISQAAGNSRGLMVDGGTTQFSVTATSANADGSTQTLSVSFEANNTKFFVGDSQDGATDTSCTIPTCDEIAIGMRGSGNNSQANGVIHYLKLHDTTEQTA